MIQVTPRGMRLHIGLFGRRNVGKSTLLNAITQQTVSIVSDVAGTTTDPVEKAMELQPIGPVLFIDTAGVDDQGEIGDRRVARTQRVLDRTEVAIVVVAGDSWGQFEEQLLVEFGRRRTPVIVVFNKCDLAAPRGELQLRLERQQVPFVHAIATAGRGVQELREALIRLVPDTLVDTPPILGDLVPRGELVVLVVPIDLEAPRGRLIMPQVQSIRDLLDHDACCMVVKEQGLADALDRLRRPPALVVTDSQAFREVAAVTPPAVPLTSFSILFARYKGDLLALTRGALAIEELKFHDRILIAEACTHHPVADDIGRVKIPRWLTGRVGKPLQFTHVQGLDFPADLEPYRLVIHCGACVQNRRTVLARIERCRQAGVPITNYGMTIAATLGILERALAPFPAALELYRKIGGKQPPGHRLQLREPVP